MDKTAKRFFLYLGAYLILHIIFRMLVSNSLEIDEAEMVLLSQQPLRLGYNSQPPLYYWLQSVFFYVFGLNIFSLALLKNALIFLTYFFLYKSAKIMIKNSLYLIFSLLSLFLVYNFSWILHKDLTHSVLLLTLSSATLYAFMRMIEVKSFKYYLLLGLFGGLGLLSKYNYAIFIISLILAGLSIKEYRPAILGGKAFLALLLMAVICLPHLAWCLENYSQLMVDKAKLNIAAGAGGFPAMGGIYAFGREAAFFLLPLFAAYLFLFPRGFKEILPMAGKNKDSRRLIGRFFIFYILVSFFMIIVYNISGIQVRWILPFLFLFPLYFFSGMADIRLAAWKGKFFIFLSAFFAVAFLFSVYLRVPLAEARRKYSRLNQPYDVLSAKIKSAYFKKGLILTADYVSGANLKLNFMDSFVACADPKINLSLPEDIEGVLLVWDENNQGRVLKKYSAEKLGLYFDEKEPLKLKALYKYSKHKLYTISFLVLKKGAGG